MKYLMFFLALLTLFLLLGASGCDETRMKTYRVKMRGQDEKIVRANGYYTRREGFIDTGEIIGVRFTGDAGVFQGEIEYVVEDKNASAKEH